MKTKTEIMYSYPSGADENNDGWSDTNVEKMMALYAKEVAIDYGHWVMKRAFPHIVNTDAPTADDEKLFDKYQQESFKP